MAAPQNVPSFDLNIARAAGERFQSYAADRDEKLRRIKEDGVGAVEPRERLAKRTNRLIDKLRATGISPEAMPPTVRELVERGNVQPHELDPVTMERVIGETRDFLSIAFVDRAGSVSRSVGRIVTNLGGGRRGFGTGFLVSPRLLLTNNHVLHNPNEAQASAVEFDYQLDLRGNPRTVARFQLDPGVFFLTTAALDFSLVAVAPQADGGRRLSEFGYLPLISEEGKALLNEPVNVIQHPLGEMKQIALRENRLLGLPDGTPFAHYACDTEPGSSGSPVCNDEWEVVGLHHSGVPAMKNGKTVDKNGRPTDDPSRIHWIANEGIRISRLMTFVKDAALPDDKKPFRTELIDAGMQAPPIPPAAPATDESRDVRQRSEFRHVRPTSETHSAPPAATTTGRSASLTVPVTITVSLGDTGGSVAYPSPSPPPGPDPGVDAFTEAIKPDPDYSRRPGYVRNFIGHSVPLPELTAESRPAALIVDADASNPYELKYYHYSVIMNESRRLAYVSAVNYDPDADFGVERGSDKWFFDPRVDQDDQAGNALYLDNPLDRGHLTRRADAAWGSTEDEARLANDDTFHWTNCSPQHEVFNQSDRASKRGLLLWGNLENHVTEQAKNDNKKMCIFNGPVFRQNDRKHRGIRIPREFYKVVVFEKDNGKPTALAFVLSQATLIKNLPTEEFEIGPYGVYQVRLSDLEKKTKLDFGALKNFEPFEANELLLEAAVEAAPLQSLSEVRL
jgi:endonuclease G